MTSGATTATWCPSMRRSSGTRDHCVVSSIPSQTSHKHVSLEVFLAFVRAAGLIAVDVSDREAILCFRWSRMVVHDPQSLQGYASPATEPDQLAS